MCGFRSRNFQSSMHTKPDIHYSTGLMPALIGWVGRVGSCAIQFHAKKNGNNSHIWTISNKNQILASYQTYFP